MDKKYFIGLSFITLSLFAGMPILNTDSIRANVMKVTTNSVNNNYRFSVTLKSDETGCEQYANWWEILSEDGKLIYRRVLAHSHPDEQPFTRSGSSVSIDKKQTLYIRAHMNNVGYSGDVFHGSVADGFSLLKNTPSFSKEIELMQPLPSGCAF